MFLKNIELGISGEFASPQGEGWVEMTPAEITAYKKNELKNELIRARANYLKQSLNRAMEYFADNLDHPEKEKRLQVKKELGDIENAKTLIALKQFNVDV